MSERGVFAVDRGVFDHERFADEPFTEREAWVWLIGEAAYRPHCRRIGSRRIELERGQLVHSTRFMAQRWKWSEARVRRFIARLKGCPPKIDAMIDADSDAGITIITIKNYSSYQRVSLPIDAESDAQNDAPATQQRRRLEDTKYTEIDDGGGAREPSNVPRETKLVSDDASSIADELAVIAGHDVKFIPPSWCGAAMRVQAWMAHDPRWTRDVILTAARAAMQRKTDGPPSSVNYFEKPIARFVAQQSAPISTVEASHAKASPNHPAAGWQQSRDSFRAAHAKLKASIEADQQFDGDGCETGDGPVIELVAASRRE